MNGKCRSMIIPHPVVGSAGWCISARSSVPINLDQVFNPAVTKPQVLLRSGKHSGKRRAVSDVSSTASGIRRELKIIPTVSEMQVAHRAENSLCAASTLQIFSALEQSTRSTSAPFPPARFRAAPKTGGSFFIPR
jgi:hypothetical protein